MFTILLLGAIPAFTHLVGQAVFEREQARFFGQQLACTTSEVFRKKDRQRQICNSDSVCEPDSRLSDLVTTPGTRVTLRGRAGLGKTWLLAKLVSDIHTKNPQLVVVLLDSKRLAHNRELSDEVNHIAFGRAAWAMGPVIPHALSKSGGIVLLDGLDEVDFAKRLAFKRHILALAAADQQTTIVVTTRPIGVADIEGFQLWDLPPLTRTEVDMALNERLSLLASKEDEPFEAACGYEPDRRLAHEFQSAAVDDSFVQGLGGHLDRKDAASISHLFRSFLKRFRLDESVTDPLWNKPTYELLGTYRDIDVIERIFVDSIRGTLPLQDDSRSFGRTQIYRRFIEQRLASSVPGRTLSDSEIARVYSVLLDYCRQMNPIENGKARFTFGPELASHVVVEKYSLADLLQRSELLKAKPLEFQSRSIDEYFFSVLLKERFDRMAPEEQRRDLANANLYPESEIVAFLLGHYRDVGQVLGAVVSVIASRSPKKARAYVQQNIGLLLAHVQRTPENRLSLAGLRTRSAFQSLPEAHAVFADAIDRWLEAGR